MDYDHFIRMGDTHLICQDYALSGTLKEDQPFAIVSDGCSSSPHTDIGARILTMSALRNLRLGYPEPYDPVMDSNEEFDRLYRTADFAQDAAFRFERTLGLKRGQASILDATLLIAVQAGDLIDCCVAGDGLVCARKRGSGDWVIHRISFSGNAPAYLSYTLHMERFYNYCQEHGVRTTQVFDGDTVTEDTEEVFARKMDYPFIPRRMTKRFRFPLDSFDLVALVSDGAESFTNASGHPVAFLEVLNHLLAFKNYKGQFVARRVNRFLSKTCTKLGWKHHDDLSISAIHIPEVTP